MSLAMKTKYFGSLCAGYALLVLAVAPQVNAQQTAKPPVNLSGVWSKSGGAGGGGPDGLHATHPSEWSTEMLPFTPKGLAMYQANKPNRGPHWAPPEQENDPMHGANPPGLYRAIIYGTPFELVQLPGKVIQMFGWTRVWRAMYTDGRPVPVDDPAGPYWYGYTVGKWEGDTLVVTTLALDERAWLDDWGTPISAGARIEERWQRVAPEKLQLTITVTDPITYSKPWTSSPVTFTLKHGVDPKEVIFAPMDEQSFNEQLRVPAATKPK